ncbi:MAG TPA: MMPL family transporter [Treponemataceae bacterium]|nr:MMPL family transporter [Treponemataceae bacterium]
MKRVFKPVFDHPVLGIIFVILLTIAAAVPILMNFRMETNLDKYMPSDHPAFAYSAEAEDRFQIRDGILIAIEHPDSVFNTGTLAKIAALETDLRSIEELSSVRIQSVHTGDNIVGSEYGLDVRPFYTEPPATEEEALAIGDLVRANPMIWGRLVARDGKSALVVTELPESGFSAALYRQVKDIAASYEGPETIYVAGRPIVEGTLAELGPKDMARMGPLVLLVIAIVLLLVLRSFSRVITTLFAVGASVVWSFGLMSLLKIPLYSVSIMIPVMLVAIGVAYAIHLYGAIDHHIEGYPLATRRDVAEHAISSVGTPAFYAALTTVAGFIALLTSRVYPVKYFGLFTAFGVAVSWLLTMILVPAVLIVVGMGRWKKKVSGRADELARNEISNGDGTSGATPHTTVSFGTRFADGIQKHAKIVYAVSAIILIFSVIGISRVWINASFLNNFEKNSPIVQTDAFVNKHFGGTSTVNIILETKEDDRFKDPELLSLVDRLQTELMKADGVGDSFSLATYLKQMHYAMNAEDPAFRAIPDSPELVAQYLLLYEMSGDPDNLWKVVDQDFNAVNITVQLKGDDSKTISAVLDVAEKFRAKCTSLGVTMNFAGSGYKSLVFSNLILTGQLTSLVLSVAIVFFLVTFLFKSFLLGAIASIPVLFSMAVNFGLMGLLNIPLTVSTALISSIAVGIGVDYAIHFITHYRNFLLKSGDETKAAHYAMSLTGKAVLLNAVIVISGFMVMLFSVFPPNRQVGALVSLNMLVAFLSTVTLMFLVLRKSAKFMKKGKTK